VNFVALRMLVGDRAKYLGIIVGLTFASLLITQQLAIFTGLMSRTFGAISDLGQPDVWVMDEKVQFIDDIKPLQDTQLYRVRGVSGVEWAVPLYKGLLKARLSNGSFQTVNLYGLDDATLIGGPPAMVEGRLDDLRRSEGVIVDEVGARTRLARPPASPGGAHDRQKVQHGGVGGGGGGLEGGNRGDARGDDREQHPGEDLDGQGAGTGSGSQPGPERRSAHAQV